MRSPTRCNVSGNLARRAFSSQTRRERILTRAVCLIVLATLAASAPSCNFVTDPASKGPWQKMNSGTDADLNGVWGFDSGDVFAVGNRGTILHFDGTQWRQMESNTTANLNDVWGGVPDHVIATGDEGTILYYDGSTWSPMESGTTESIGRIWGVYSNLGNDRIKPFVAYATGGGPAGTILYFDFYEWHPIDTGATEHLNDITGWSSVVWDAASPSPWLMAVGDNGTAEFFDGYDWVGLDTGIDENLTAVFGECPNNVYCVGRDGAVIQNTKRFVETGPPAAWREIGHLAGSGLADIAARQYNDLFFVGADGQIVNFDRQEFNEMRSPTSASLHAVWSGATRVYAVGEQGTILRYSRTPRSGSCPINVRVTATQSMSPVIDWSPSCPVSKVIVENEWGTVQWFIETDGNLIQPGVEYGTVPAGAIERRPTYVGLETDKVYRVSLIRRDWDRELVVGTWNLSPQATGSGGPVVLSPSRRTDMQLASDPYARFFHFQPLVPTQTGPERYEPGAPARIMDGIWRMHGDPVEREDALNVRPVIVEVLDRDPETREYHLYALYNIRAADIPQPGGKTVTVVWDVLDSD